MNHYLTLIRCENITDQGLISAANLFHKRSTFKNISLNFLKYSFSPKINLFFESCHRITDEAFAYLAEGLKKQKNLESMSLVFE